MQYERCKAFRHFIAAVIALSLMWPRGVSCPNKIKLQWWIQDFPDGVWAPTPQLGVQTYYLASFFAENWMKI